MKALKTYWKSRSSSEQRLLWLAGIVIASAALYLSLSPLYKRYQRLDATIAKQQAQLQTLQSLAAQIPPPTPGQSALTAVDSAEALQAFAMQQAQMQQIPAPVINASSANQLQAQWTQVDFNKVLTWLESMQQQGLQLELFNATLTQTGQANVEISLNRP